ncbi:mitochondrial genome maintenance MGM101-domain-containing protein [Blastocladiella britannica]|nr:mitochondrial genome maintenance MGM101-domain-containing protein [Blastocladiella britannica]
MGCYRCVLFVRKLGSLLRSTTSQMMNHTTAVRMLMRTAAPSAPLMLRLVRPDVMAAFAARHASSTATASKTNSNMSGAADASTMDKLPRLIDQTLSPLVASESQTFHRDGPDAFVGMATEAFPDPVVDILLADINPDDVEIKPDGLLYLPEIKYRRILNRAFKPGGWALVPRGPHSLTGRMISREYALYCYGRFVSQARGEQEVFDEKLLPTAIEGCKSNALLRCSKDLGIASELWDPSFIRKFKADHCEHVWAKNAARGTKSKLWRLKGARLEYPWEEMR